MPVTPTVEVTVPYKPTGRPVGRPRTSVLTAISVKLPHDLLLEAIVEARRTQTTLAAVLREGLQWRITHTAEVRAALCAQRRTERAAAEVQRCEAEERLAEAEHRITTVQVQLAEAEERLATVMVQLATERWEASQAARAARLEAARLEQEIAGLRQILGDILEPVPVAPTRGQLGSLASIVTTLAPTHPDGVTAAQVLDWCQANRVTWATPELVAQALETLKRDYGYTAIAGPDAE